MSGGDTEALELLVTIKLLLSWVQLNNAQLTTIGYAFCFAFSPRFLASEQAHFQIGSRGHEFLPACVCPPLKALYGALLWKTNELLYF